VPLVVIFQDDPGVDRSPGGVTRAITRALSLLKGFLEIKARVSIALETQKFSSRNSNYDCTANMCKKGAVF
jgi:hypothetical protein